MFYLNFEWIWFNVSLALVAVVLGLLFTKVSTWYLKLACFILWFLFVPNTVYLVTDLQYLPEQLAKVQTHARYLLIVQYGLVAAAGVATFLIAVYQLQHYLMHVQHRRHRLRIFMGIALLNYLIAFAVILGKIERTHSWYVFTDFSRVIDDMQRVLSSPFTVANVLLAGSIINLLYFSVRKLAVRLRAS